MNTPRTKEAFEKTTPTRGAAQGWEALASNLAQLN